MSRATFQERFSGDGSEWKTRVVKDNPTSSQVHVDVPLGSDDEDLEKVLRQEDGKWVLYNHDGSKTLGTFDTKEAALAREQQINYFKHVKKLQSDAPHYREAAADQNCGNCAHGGDGYCDAYHFNVNNAFVCDSHEPLVKQFDKYTPPQEVQANARRAKETYGNSDTKLKDEEVLLMMEALSNGRPLTLEELTFVRDYQTEHYQVEDPESWGSHGPEWQAWNALGGRAGLSWSRRILRKEQEQQVGKRLMEEWFYFSEEASMPEDRIQKNCGGLRGVILKTERKQVFGWASIISKSGEPISDLQGDIISAEELEKLAYSFVLNCRNAGEMHQKVGVGKLIESMVLTVEKAEAMGIALPEGVEGWWTGWQITDDAVWDKVKGGTYQSFSVHGRGIRTEAT